MKMIPLTLALTILSAGAAVAQPRMPSADSNGDGKVTLAEFKASRAGLLMRGDANKDGKLSKAEIEAATGGAGRPGGGPGGGGMFARLDANGDGFVTRAEIETASTRRFQGMDANKDGVLTGAEMAGGRGPGHPGG
ncbi:MAG: signal transduction protein [Pseudomonadota bacterium]